MIPEKKLNNKSIFFWQLFRLFFVLFFLYLLGDAFYRWDGFRFFASFSEYLPSVALVSIFWTIAALLTTLLSWILFKSLQWLLDRIGLRISIEHSLLYVIAFLLIGLLAWKSKRLIWPDIQTTIHVKLFVLISVALLSFLPLWLFRNRIRFWFIFLQERITPLVWLFGIWAAISVPLVSYHTWIKHSNNTASYQNSKISVEHTNRPNIILVIFDALAARDMSVYGYHRETTPFISKWAMESSLFTKLEAAGNQTSTTTASLMTGKRIWTHQTYHIYESSRPDRIDRESLPLLLKKKGYHNMAFVVNRYASVKRLGISKFFDVAPIPSEFWKSNSLRGDIDIVLFRLFGDKIRSYRWIFERDFIPGDALNKSLDLISKKPFRNFPLEKAFNRFFDAVDNNAPEPFFAWIHLYPPHHPYVPPEPYKGIFEDTHTEKESDVDRISYDEFIRYCDEGFEDFIKQLNESNKLKNTVIILSTDHGESFEHDYISHGGSHLYEPVTHIPLIIKEPGQTEGRIINDLVEQIDIPVTILELANIPVPPWMEGKSLLPLMRGNKLPSKTAFSMNLEKNPSRGKPISKGTIAVWKGDYKLIHYLEEDKSLLFNLSQDPDEMNNLYNKEPLISQQLLAIIRDNLQKANERIAAGK